MKEDIFLNQRKYALELITDASVLGTKPLTLQHNNMRNLLLLSSTSFLDLRIFRNQLVKQSVLDDPESCKRLVGRLIYLTSTQPNICYAVQQLSQFMHSPKLSHMDAAMQVVKYLKDSPGMGISLSAQNPLTLSVYCDSDWVSCPMTRRCLTGFFFFLSSLEIP